jgi:ATP-binding cassette subfamily B protein
MPNAEGGFEDVREKLDGHPMKLLFGYAATYWKRLVLGVLLALVMRLMILIPDLAVSAAIDRILAREGEPGILAQVGLMGYALPGRADHHVLILLAFMAMHGAAVRLLLERPAGRVAWAAGAWAALEDWTAAWLDD